MMFPMLQRAAGGGGGGGDQILSGTGFVKVNGDGSVTAKPTLGKDIALLGRFDPVSVVNNPGQTANGFPSFGLGNAGIARILMNGDDGVGHVNTKMKQGISIKAGIDNVYELISLKGSHHFLNGSVDPASGTGHPSFGGTTDHDTFMYIKMQSTSVNSGNGGPSLAGFSASSGLPVWLIRAYVKTGWAAGNNVAKTTAAQGMFDFKAIYDDGAGGTTSMPAGSNIATFRNNSTTRFAIAESSLYLADAANVPAANPTGGVLLYSEGAKVKIRDTAGVITVLNP